MARLTTESTVRVSGLNETIRALKKAGDAERLGLLKDVFYEGASLVVRRAQGNASSKMERAASEGLKASRTQYRAQVGFTERRGFEMGAEFGAARGQMRTGPSGRRFAGYNQFEAWRGNGAGAGYFLWPAIRETSEQIAENVGDEIVRIFERG